VILYSGFKARSIFMKCVFNRCFILADVLKRARGIIDNYQVGRSFLFKPTRGPGQKACSLLIRVEASLSHGGQGESLLPPYARGSVSLSHRARATACCLLIRAEASLSHGGQGESLLPPYTLGSVSLSRGPD